VAAVASFLLVYLVIILVVFSSDLSRDELELYSFSADKEEYLASIPGLKYSSTRDNAGNNESPREPDFVTLRELFEHWHPDDTSAGKWATSVAHPDRVSSAGLRRSLHRFDYSSEADMEKALLFRERELPFVLYNVPELDEATERVFSIPSLLANFGSTPRIVERSRDNHFMYYTTHTTLDSKVEYASWRPPQREVPLTMAKFLRLAEEAERRPTSSGLSSSASLHYLTINAGEGGHTPWISDALPFFSSHLKGQQSFMIVDSEGYKGINCRFGMRGVTAAAHYDGQRNFVAMIRGRKRYVLLPPRACKKLSLLPKGHPSARHSFIDWSELLPSNSSSSAEQEREQEPGRILRGEGAEERAAEILEAPATEYVLARGEVLYIPSYWFHYIVSQDASVQCNARSGASADEDARQIIRKCMNSLPAFHSPSGDPGSGHRGQGALRGASFEERARHFKAMDSQWTLES